jgi:hypothetical protein
MHEPPLVPATSPAVQGPPGPGSRPASGPAGPAGDSPETLLRLAEDQDRIAEGLNDIVVRRLFSAGLALEAALGLIGEHRAAGKIEHAISELDRAIADLRGIGLGRSGCGQGPAGLQHPGSARDAGRGFGIAEGSGDPAQQGPDRRCRGWARARPVTSCAAAAGRRPEDRRRREAAGQLPGSGQRQVSVHGREHPASWPGGLPSQGEDSGLFAGCCFPVMHAGQPGNARSRAARAGPDHLGGPVAVRAFRRAGQHARGGQAHKPGPGDREAEVHQDLAGEEHASS